MGETDLIGIVKEINYNDEVHTFKRVYELKARYI